jgi:hypothetical protein
VDAALEPAVRDVCSTVGVVIVNWNAGDDLRRCVETLRAGIGGQVDEIVVVDNGSVDGSIERLGNHAGLRMVEMGRNLGFAAGVNRGARECHSDLLLLLNPDVRVLAGAVDAAVRYLGAHPEVGIVGAVLVDERGRWQPSSGRFGVLGHLLLDTRVTRRSVRSSGYVDWVHGAFLLLPRTVFEQLRGLDEAFFMYGEDIDLCARARRLGWRTAIVAEARAIHLGNRSGAIRWGDERDAEVIKGEMRFHARAGVPGRLMLFRVVAASKFTLKMVLYAITGRFADARRTWRVVRACVTFRPERAAVGGGRDGGG